MDNSSDFFSRSRLLLGDKVMDQLQSIKVILFGVGGVGSWAAETLVRTGLYNLTMVDFDAVAPSNINRQLPALSSTIGEPKVEMMKRHLLMINPAANITTIEGLYSPETASLYDFNDYDYVIDAIDSLRDKALLINNVTRSNAILFSSMGAALKTDPLKIKVAEFRKVEGCRLAAALRHRFKRENLYPAKKFKCVFSPEQGINLQVAEEALVNSPINKVHVNGSLMQITATFGIALASLVINSLIEQSNGTA